MNKTRQMPRQNHMQKMFVDKCLPWVLDIPACNILAKEHTEWLCKSTNWICSTYFYIKCLVHTSLLFMGKYECKSFKGLQHPCSSVKLKSDCHSNSLHIPYARHHNQLLITNRRDRIFSKTPPWKQGNGLQKWDNEYTSRGL